VLYSQFALFGPFLTRIHRERWSKKNRTSGVKDDTNWVMKRGEEREKLRRGEERADWIFER